MTAYESEYQGARFFKCDLQMHTPADCKHWLGEKMGQSQAEQRAAAESYIRRCYEVGLEVIAITDHNLASKQFISFLKDAITSVKAEYGYELILFPGFEVQGPVGKGAHLICIFAPDISLDCVDARLSQLGLPPDRRFDNAGLPNPVPTADMTLEKMLDIVQGDNQAAGICVGAHPNDTGVMDSQTVEQWWSQEVIRNEKFLCIELPRPREEYTKKTESSLVKSILLNEDGRYQRRRAISSVCSSDAKKLMPSNGSDTNHIGFRHTWIKMSHPSVEALRQASLDHESRIRFGSERPEVGYTYSKIRSVKVGGAAFLADQSIALSPNLTTLIGGRGTGKSTVIEYLRVALGAEAAIQGEDPRKNLQRLKGSIHSDTAISLTLEKEGQVLTVESRGANPPAVVSGPAAPDLPRYFPTRILSQKEIYAIAEDPGARRGLVDDVVRRQLDELRRREEDLIQEIKSLNQQIGSLAELRERERVLETERRDFGLKLERLKALEAPLANWRGRLAEERFFDTLPEEAQATARQLSEAAEAVEFRCTAVGDEIAEAPAGPLVQRVAEDADQLLEALKTVIRQAVVKFESGIRALLEHGDVQRWKQDLERHRTEYEKLRTELQAQGTDPAQYFEYQRNLREREVQLAELRTRIAHIGVLKERRDGKHDNGKQEPGLIDQLTATWRKQYDLRNESAQKLAQAVPKTSSDEPFVKVSVALFGDDGEFMTRLRQEIKDGRRMSPADMDEFSSAVLKDARPARGPVIPPSHMLAVWLSELRQGRRPANCPWPVADRRTRALLDWLGDDQVEELRLWRTPDRVSVELYRQDGSRVGDLDDALSVGQRCTAVLGLLLAQGVDPLIVDQPEEDLDNEFVYSELVPLLRSAKEKRQVIVATHNANIPVNGDAELVVALEVRDRHGHVKLVQGEGALGALDRQAVKRAVEDIMEGSEEAFRRRFEKYGF